MPPRSSRGGGSGGWLRELAVVGPAPSWCPCRRRRPGPGTAGVASNPRSGRATGTPLALRLSDRCALEVAVRADPELERPGMRRAGRRHGGCVRRPSGRPRRTRTRCPHLFSFMVVVVVRAVWRASCRPPRHPPRRRPSRRMRPLSTSSMSCSASGAVVATQAARPPPSLRSPSRGRGGLIVARSKLVAHHPAHLADGRSRVKQLPRRAVSRRLRCAIRSCRPRGLFRPPGPFVSLAGGPVHAHEGRQARPARQPPRHRPSRQLRPPYR